VRARSALPFVPAFAVAATWVVWAIDDGGYFAIDRYPGALLAAGLLLTLAVARPPGSLVRSPALLPLALLGAWAVWNGVSLAWSSAPDNGWESTNELLAAVVMGAVMAFTPWRPRSVTALFGFWAAAIALVAVVDLVTFGTTSDPGSRLLEARYLGPVGYVNGTAALGAMAFWPLLAIAAAPRLHPAVRVVALPAAVAVLAWALLPQSRGTVLAGLVAIPLFVAFSSHRVQVLARMVVVAGSLLIAVPALFDVYTAAAEHRALDTVVETAVIRTGIATGVALLASLLLVAAERRARPSERTLRWTRRVGVAAVVVAVLAGAGVAAASQERIRSGVSDRWHTFSSFADVVNTNTGPRIGQVVPDKRYDYWRTALEAFRDQPVVGTGIGSFQIRYAAEKRYPKHSRYVHDIWLRAMADTGVVGLLLLVAALATGMVALVRARRRADAAAYPVIAAAATLSTAFFLQCSLDWLEEVPALLAPAVGLPLAAMRAAAPDGQRRVPWGVPAALAVLALVVMTPPYLAVRNIKRGDALRASDPQAALAAYDRAASLNPLAVEPYLSRGFVGLDLHDAALARRSFEQALDVREDWVAHFELGLLDSQAGRRRAAREQLTLAERMDRSDKIVTDALAAVEDGKRLDPVEVNRQVLAQRVFSPPP
jgi:tetratricopeptide (TPR) repeat protein